MLIRTAGVIAAVDAGAMTLTARAAIPVVRRNDDLRARTGEDTAAATKTRVSCSARTITDLCVGISRFDGGEAIQISEASVVAVLIRRSGLRDIVRETVEVGL